MFQQSVIEIWRFVVILCQVKDHRRPVATRVEVKMRAANDYVQGLSNSVVSLKPHWGSRRRLYSSG